MFSLTSTAAKHIYSLTSQSDKSHPGLRITSDSPGTLRLSFAEAPAEGESVVDASGVKVFLDQQAARVLDDKTLDVKTEADGKVRFEVAQQGG